MSQMQWRVVVSTVVALYLGGGVASAGPWTPARGHAPASFRARRAGGDEFPAEASISQTTVAGRRLFTVILRDVTKRLQTEETLHQSEDRLQTALEVGRMGTWTFDFDTKEVWADDKMLKLVGRTRADWPKGPQGAAELVHPEDRAAVWEGLRIDPSDPGPAMVLLRATPPVASASAIR